MTEVRIRRRVAFSVALLTIAASAAVILSAFAPSAALLVVFLVALFAGSMAIATSGRGAAKAAASAPPPTLVPPDPPEMTEDLFLSKLNDAVLITSREGVIARASRGVEKILGYAPAALHTKRVASLLHEDCVAEATQAVIRVAGGTELHLPQRWKVRMADSAWLSERGDSGRSPERRWASQARTSAALTFARSDTASASPRCCSRKAM